MVVSTKSGIFFPELQALNKGEASSGLGKLAPIRVLMSGLSSAIPEIDVRSRISQQIIVLTSNMKIVR